MSIELRGRRILHVVGGSSYGGGSKVILDLAEGAVREGAIVDVLTTNEQMASEARSTGVGVVALDVIRREIHPFRDFAGLVGLVRHMRSSNYDIVHTHTSKAGVLGRMAAFAARTPVVVHTVHGYAFHERSTLWGKALVIALERLAALVSNRVVTVSHHHARVSRQLHIVPERKLTAIPNGIREPVAVDQESMQRIRTQVAPAGQRVLLCHGRLAPQKGITYLIQALGLLERLGDLPSDVRLCIAGDGPQREELQSEAVALGIESRVVFLGFRTDIDALIDAADLVVLPSLWEGLSIALMEAMSRGATIAASDIPSNLELIRDGENALLFPAADSAALADLLRRVLSGEVTLDGLGERAHGDIRSTHTLARMQTAYNTLYSEELAKSIK